jgi:alkaline phosphatase D
MKYFVSLWIVLLLLAPVSALGESLDHEIWKCDGRFGMHLDTSLRPFYHGVASGDPLRRSVIIWTRVTPFWERCGWSFHLPVRVRWQVATDPELNNVVQQGVFKTGKWRDYTVKIEVDGLKPGRVYYYGFRALGKSSLTGRTKTLPRKGVDEVRFAHITCPSFQWGYFNGFERIAERNDLDAILTMGDYIYEYEPAEYQHPELIGERDPYPPKELIELEDYRGRYYQYRLSPGLRKAHQQHPMIAIWDDHETANDSWMHGAENHDPETEGSWEKRVANALKAYDEWIPIRMRHPNDKEIYRRFKYGDLVDLVMTEARLVGREEQILPKGQDGSLTEEQLVELYDPDRTLLGRKQLRWLTRKLVNSKAQWKIVSSSVMMMQLFGFGPNGMGNLDAWDGYPAEREKIFEIIRSYGIRNFGVLSGDFHTSFAAALQSYGSNNDVPVPLGAPIGFEFTTPSISAANINELEALQLPDGSVISPLDERWPERHPVTLGFEQAFLGGNPHIEYINLDQHGYAIIGFNEERAQADFYYVDTVLEPSTGVTFAAGWSVATDSTALTPAAEMPPLSDTPPPAPPYPPSRR